MKNSKCQEIIEARVSEVADYIISTKDTVRGTAKKFGYSKSTIYNDMTIRLPEIKPQLCEDILDIMGFNKAERSSRAGEKTKERSQQRKVKMMTIC